MKEIDEMDILAFLKIRAWQIKREKKKKEPKAAYIDTIWKTLTPGRR